MKPSISFFFPYYEVSGCPVLFLNVLQKIEELYPNKYDLKIVDYADGYMATHLPPTSSVTLMTFKTGEYCEVSTDYIVMQAYLPQAIRPELKIASRTKVLMWMLMPMNFLPVVFPFNFLHGYIETHLDQYSNIVKTFYKKDIAQAREFLESLLKANAVAFMNESDMPAVKKMLGVENVNPPYIPIAPSDPRKVKEFHESDILNMGWVGRLCDFKITILNFVLEQLYKYAISNKRKIQFHVIGSGDKANLLFMGSNEFFKIIRVGSLTKDQLDDYMLENIDINFAMGTSIIESSKLGIPSVKLDFSYDIIPENYCPDWFHNAKGYDVGHVIDNEDLSKNNFSFENLINDFDKDKHDLSLRSKNHYREYFSLEMVTNKILKQLDLISASWGEIPNNLKEIGFVRKVYYKIKYNI